MEMDEKIKMKAMQKLDELKAILEPAGMDVDDFVQQYDGDEEEAPEGEMPAPPMGEEPMGEESSMGKKDPAKIALIVARLKKKGG